MTFNRDTQLFIKNLIQPYTVYKESKLLVDQYFKYKKIDINFPMEKYDGYMNFIKVVKQFLNPTRETTNRKLQDIIVDYANNRSGSDPTRNPPQFVIIADSLIKCFDNFNPKCTIIKDKSRRDIVKSFIDTGISEININIMSQHKYEIYVHLDLVEGHLTPQNTNQINCVYQDSKLTDRFEILINQKRKGDWLFSPAPFIKIPPEGKGDKPTRLANARNAVSSFFEKFTTRKTTAKKVEAKPEVKAAKKGGKRKRRLTRRIKK